MNGELAQVQSGSLDLKSSYIVSHSTCFDAIGLVETYEIIGTNHDSQFNLIFTTMNVLTYTDRSCFSFNREYAVSPNKHSFFLKFLRTVVVIWRTTISRLILFLNDVLNVVLYFVSNDSPSFMTNMGIWNDVIVINKMTKTRCAYGVML